MNDYLWCTWPAQNLGALKLVRALELWCGCARGAGEAAGSMMGALPVGLGGLMQVGISVFDPVHRLVCLARSVPRGAVRE